MFLTNPFATSPVSFAFPLVFLKKRIKKNSEKGAGNESNNTNKSLHVMNFYFNSPKTYININSSQVSILTKAVLLLTKMTCVIILANDDVDSLRVKTFY